MERPITAPDKGARKFTANCENNCVAARVTVFAAVAEAVRPITAMIPANTGMNVVIKTAAELRISRACESISDSAATIIPAPVSTPTVVNTCDSLSEELSASGADNPHSIITPHSDTSNLSGAEIFSVSTSHNHESALPNVMLPAPPSGVIPSP